MDFLSDPVFSQLSKLISTKIFDLSVAQAITANDKVRL